MQDEAGLDRLAQAHLVGEQHPGYVAPADFMGNVELVRNQFHPATQQAPHRRTAGLVASLKRFQAERKGCRVIHLAGEQALLGLVERHGVRQPGFG